MQELEVIMELMEELRDKMEYGEEDFSERLGRKKPEIEVVKLEGEMPMEEGMEDEEEMSLEMPESPEEKFKKRLSKLRS